MKMKELEERTGVGREAIRFYIREGLLHEPEKPKPNVARYDEEHVRRVLLIKKLQKERFLPLGVIKSLLEAEGGALADEPPALFGMDVLLASRLGSAATREAVPLKEAAKETGLTLAIIEALADAGLVEITMRGKERILGPYDLAIARVWARMREAGYSGGLELEPAKSAFYAEDMGRISEKQVDLFFNLVGDKLDMREAVDLAQAGLSLSLEILELLNFKSILKAIAKRNATLAEEQAQEKNPEAAE